MSAIGVPHGTVGDSGGPPTNNTHPNTNYARDSHGLPGMLPNSLKEEASPTAQQQLHCTNEPTTALFGRLQRRDLVDSSSSGKAELNVGELIKR